MSLNPKPSFKSERDLRSLPLLQCVVSCKKASPIIYALVIYLYIMLGPVHLKTIVKEVGNNLAEFIHFHPRSD
jgi:hypothetical protein